MQSPEHRQPLLSRPLNVPTIPTLQTKRPRSLSAAAPAVLSPSHQSFAANTKKIIKRVRPSVQNEALTRREKERENQARLYKKQTEEKLRRWIDQYEKAFPSFAIYFDCCPEEEVKGCTRKINILKGRVKRFFDKEVTHVITTREIPLDSALVVASSPGVPQPAHSDKPPSLSKFTFNLAYKTGLQLPPPYLVKPALGAFKEPLPNNDILTKARKMNIKIWSLEKFKESILKVLLPYAVEGHDGRTLSRSLQHEKQVGQTSEQDPSDSIHTFKGPYILVRDLTETYRPIMCREWPIPAKNSEGEWPQWRITRLGRCPFVRDTLGERTKSQTTITRKVSVEKLVHRQLAPEMNASGIAQSFMTSAIQSNHGKQHVLAKENMVVASLQKKIVENKSNKRLATPKTIELTDAKKIKVDNKSGYCENCREKFSDFDEHLQSTKHMAYATKSENFFELDQLLLELARPIKHSF